MARKSRKNIEAEPLKAAIYVRTAMYVRLSVEDGNGRSNSIENQQLILNDYIADKPEFEVVDIYIDNGLSGMTFDRPEFQRMLEDIERGAVNCVIVKDISRLGRNAIDTGYYIEQYFVERKIRFISVTDNYDSADKKSAQDGLLLSLKAMINESYALDIAKKEKSAKRQLMLSGKLTNGHAPFGYVLDPNDRQRLVIDEEAAQTVRQIYEWYVSGIGRCEIARKLNEAGIKTRSKYKNPSDISDKGTYWTAHSVTSILKNENYTGDMVQGKFKRIDRKNRRVDKSEQIIVRNTHDPIISRDMFEKAQQLLTESAEKEKGKTKTPSSPSVFSCQMVCPHCGKNLYRQKDISSSGKAHYYFACTSRYRFSTDACVGVRITETQVNETVLEAVNTEIAALGNAFTGIASDDTNRTEALNKQKSDKQRELSRVQSLVRGLYENLVQGIISNDEYTSFKSEYSEQISSLKSEIEQINGDIDNINKQREQYQEAQKSSKAFRRSKKLTSELVEGLIERIEINHAREITVMFKSGREFRKECS